MYAEGSFPVASITYQIGENGYYNEFECDGTCQGSLSANGCGNSVDIELHEGSNLMSFSLLPEDSSVGNVLSDDNILAIAGEGEAALNTDNGDVYVGEIVSGQPHGQGTRTYTNGNKYEGEWINGRWDGQGTWIEG